MNATDCPNFSCQSAEVSQYVVSNLHGEFLFYPHLFSNFPLTPHLFFIVLLVLLTFFILTATWVEGMIYVSDSSRKRFLIFSG